MQLKMKLVLLLFMLFSVSLGEMAQGGEEDDLELERQANLMNRPPVKTFVTEKGDIIDCVDINKQPALDHPLLKNHKVQTRPNLHFASFPRSSANAKSAEHGSRKACPVGTVPIPRVTKEALVRARSLPKMPSVVATGPNSPPSNQHAVFLRDDMVKNIKYGGGGGTTIYNLTVASDQCSFHNIWIQTGPPNHISMIVAGGSVCPRLNGDMLPRLFTYWTGDGYRNGCYNVLCPGFVQVDRTVTTGYPVQPASVYGGQQYELRVYIHQDIFTGNWLLYVSHPSILVGYWPKELFLNLRNGSLHVAWGGVGLAGSDGVCPPMGSGHKPDGDHTHAGCFRGLFWMSSHDEFYPPMKEAEWVDGSNVYGLKNDHYQEEMGYTITYGGPGGYCGR